MYGPDKNERLRYIRRHFGTDELFYDIISRTVYCNSPEDATEKNTVNLTSLITDAPLRVYFDPSYRCNLNCRHCINCCSPDVDTTGELSFSRIEKLIDELASIGVLELVITGGEPLLHPRIFDIIGMIRSAGMNLSITSNGTLITPSVAGRLAEMGVNDIRVSIDGHETVHDGIRGEGSYRKSLEGIRNLVREDVCVSVRTTLSPGIREGLSGMFHDLHSAGVTRLKLAVVKEAGNAGISENSDLHGYWPGEGVIEQFMELGKEYGISVELSGDDFDTELLGTVGGKVRSFNSRTCGAGFETTYISPNGDVMLCPAIPGIVLGNIKGRSFMEVWRGMPADRFRELALGSGEIKLCKAGFVNLW